MKTIFISLPMKDKTEEEILKQIDDKRKQLEPLGFHVIDSYLNTPSKTGSSPLHCLAVSLAVMADCDAVYFCKGWQNARGCKIEYEAARNYGLKIIFE